MKQIGDVYEYQIKEMCKFISCYGLNAFREAVWHGAFLENSLNYVHPAEELEKTKNFKLIQEAFIDAVC
jgi:hypothetical protein